MIFVILLVVLCNILCECAPLKENKVKIKFPRPIMHASSVTIGGTLNIKASTSNRETENTYYRPTINNNFQSMHWTSRNPGNMYRLPRPIKIYDSIEIMCELQRRDSLVFALCHENNSPAGKIEVNFQDKNIYEYKDGRREVMPDTNPDDIFTESHFTLAFKVDSQTDDGDYVINVSIEPAVDLCTFNVNNISSLSYIEMGNDVAVTKLSFNY